MFILYFTYIKSVVEIVMTIFCSLSPYTYTCDENELIGGHDIASRCIRIEKTKLAKNNPTMKHNDLNGCKMTCGVYGALWPRPTGHVNLSETLFEVFPDNVAIQLHSTDSTNDEGRT